MNDDAHNGAMPGINGPVGALVPAGGAGSRLGSTRKQFRALQGEPVLVRTLRVFDTHPRVDHLFLAAPEDRVDTLFDELTGFGLTKVSAIVCGGRTRQESVWNALKAVPASVPYLLVHDAVRPFVSAQDADAVIASVTRFGAAALGVPVADTLRQVSDGVYGGTVPRVGLFRMQTPQAFRTDWLRMAHARARQEGVEATDDVELVQRIGRAVYLVTGSPMNFKITTPEDWAYAGHIAANLKSS